MYPQFIAVGFSLYLNLKNLLIFQVSEILEGKTTNPQFMTWLHREAAVGKEKKKRKEERKQKKAVPTGYNLCLGSWTRRHFFSALAPPPGSVHILGSLPLSRGRSLTVA